jgi:hypothetical protein
MPAAGYTRPVGAFAAGGADHEVIRTAPHSNNFPIGSTTQRT